ncbi:uncharacterized protein LOC127079584 [Lathyrus oleraceus]|uniref:uncharacterized protein LOC127079584 n=1 Tax=Pisum sativum TaxID=3888 RepID=UPI0021CF0306|nr:uncharacterized protein LOC127079584 [Pisum sativum]
MERELVNMFMDTLQGPYYDRMVGSTSTGFSEFVMAGERIEVGLKMGGMPPPPERLPGGYNPNAHCEFHSGGIGHDVENCWALKYKVQELLDSKAIQFTPNNGANVIQNLMPAHGGSTVNMMEEGESLNLIMDVNLLSTPLPCVKSYLIQNGVFPGCSPDCCECQNQPNGCVSLKIGIQSLINEGILQYDKILKDGKVVDKEVAVISIPYTPANISAHARPTPLTITLPGPIPYSRENVVPWHYGSDVYYHGVKQEGRRSKDNPNNVDALERAKGKQVVSDDSGSAQVNTPNVVPETSSSQEVEELLRLIRKSDYKVIDHLNQTPSKISILSLLLCSEAHGNALMKLLSSAFVSQNITVNQLERVVANISADNGLGFIDFDLPQEGCNHNKALHIFMECKGTTLSHMLVDTGSSLNVMHKYALMKIDYIGVELPPSDLIVRVFDGSRRAIFGEVDLPVKIGPQVFGTTFFVMDIQPAYCCLLGRPWIHGAGDVTSILHHKMKFPSGGKIVIVCGEEEYMMIKTPRFEDKRHVVSISSLKDARAVVESGHPEGWGRVLDLPLKSDKLGPRFSISQQGIAPQAPKILTSMRFTSVGFINNDQANVVGDDDDSDYDIDNWIRPSVPGEELCNWTAKDVTQVTINQESTSASDPIDSDFAITHYDFHNPIYQVKEEGDKDCELPEELARLLRQEEKVIQPHQEDIEVVNLGNEDDIKEVRIGSYLEESVKTRLIDMLREFTDIFAWSYQDMSRLDADIVLHMLPLKEECPPVKKKL